MTDPGNGGQICAFGTWRLLDGCFNATKAQRITKNTKENIDINNLIVLLRQPLDVNYSNDYRSLIPAGINTTDKVIWS